MTEAALYPVFVGAWMGLAAVVFVALLFIPAPYGRYRRAGWGPTVRAPLGWVLMELPAVITILVFYLVGDRRGDPTALVFLFLWQLHYLQRTFIFPLRLRSGDRRTPLTIVALGVIFNLINGYVNGRYLFSLGPPLPPGWLGSPVFLGGTLLFLTGWGINLWSDHRLFQLRDGSAEYRIPRGGLFRFVSCPNYLGELLEWCGWAVATWSLGGLSFALWTAANLVPRALTHHRWYRERFPDYPAERKAILPFLL